MLIKFNISNFRSFAREGNLNLITAPGYKSDLPEQIFSDGRRELLNTCVVYGPNSAGKSNLFLAMDLMKHFVLNSQTFRPGEELHFEPFLFNKDKEKEPTALEILISLEGILYRYGFAYNEKEIVSEWLYQSIKKYEVELFYRDYQTIESHPKSFNESKENLKDQTKKNTLHLSVLAANNGKLSTKIVNWFNNCNVVLGTQHEKYKEVTINLLKSKQHYDKILELFKKSDLFIEDIIFEEGIVKTIHNIYNSKKEIVGTKKIDLIAKESKGTNKLFDLAGPIVDSLLNGKILWIDEMDSSLHTFQTQSILHLFHQKKTNPKNAQLILNTHDTNLLNQSIFRRDQIWFVEKEYDENTKLYSLLDYKPEIRNDAALEKRYLEGSFGAIPYLKG